MNAACQPTSPNQPCPPGKAAFQASTYGYTRLTETATGLLVETLDRGDVDRSELRVVTKRRPTLEELTDLLERKVHLFLHVKVRETWAEERGTYEGMGLDFDV